MLFRSTLNLIDGKNKILIPMNVGVYNFFHVNYYQIFNGLKTYPGSKIILDIMNKEPLPGDMHYYNFLINDNTFPLSFNNFLSFSVNTISYLVTKYIFLPSR